MFESATFDSRGALPNQAPRWMLVTLAANLAIVSAMIVLPLINPESLPSRLLHPILFVPPNAPANLPQTRAQSTLPASSHFSFVNLHNETQRLTPGDASSDPGPANPDGQNINLAGSVPGGVNTGPQIFAGSKPVVLATSAPKRTVSIGVGEGLLISKPMPPYPQLAKTIGVSGTVTLSATITTAGTLENIRVLSGPVMLRQPAADAVRNWRYRPYLLNSQPVEVDTTISVVYSLGGR